jgi:hypothetical protein
MALSGHAADAWDWSKHFAVQRAVHGPHLTELYAWHYPPPFLLIASSLALIPYIPALIAWQAITIVSFVLVMQRLVPGRDSMLVTLGAPVAIICLAQGQNGFLTALLIGGGLVLLDDRPLLAGLLFGCLIYKPQFGLVLPALMLAGRHWRAISGALISAGLLLALTFVLWGWPVWHAFLESLPQTRSVIIEHGATGFYKIMSPFAAVRMWGAPVGAAYAVQATFAAGALAAVVWTSLPSKNAPLRNATICAAALVATPYVLDYDFVLLLPALAWLYTDGHKRGFLPWDATVMAFVWCAPLFARIAALEFHVPLGALAALSVGALALRRCSSWHPVAIRDVHSSGEQQVREP